MYLFPRLIVRWLKKFEHLWKVEVNEDLSAEEIENNKSKKLEEEYLEKKQSELNEAYSVLGDQDTKIEEEQALDPEEYDVGEVEVEYLLEKNNLDSHYDLNVVEAKIEDSDTHLLGAKKIEP